MKRKLPLIAVAAMYSLLNVNYAVAQENVISENGNVGIGTTNPTEKLQVNGTARIDSMLIVKDSMIVHKGTIFQDNLTVEGDLKLTGNAYFNSPIYYPNSPVASNAQGLKLLGTDETGIVKSLTYAEMVKTPSLLTCLAEPDGTYLPYWKTGTSKVFVDCPNTHVGINTYNPTHNLHLIGNQLTEGTGQFTRFGINCAPNQFSSLNVQSGNNGAAVELTSNNPGQYTKLLFMHANSPGTEIMKVVKDSDDPSIVRFMLTADGFMQIHNGVKKTLQLDTDGLLHARRVKVDVVNWPDYVFESNHKLPTIEEVDTYIQENNHLPGIPDAASMEKNGLDVTEANKMLMEQVEEQMLYIIQLKKELEQLKSEFSELKKGE
jgi:hypothetical protein